MKNPTSFRASEAIQGTAAFVASLRSSSDEQGATRRALSAMAKIMAEVGREKKRAWLEQSHSVSIALDDRGAHRIVRFRCDVCGAAGPDGKSGGTRAVEGILCVQTDNGNASQRRLKDLDKDYSAEMAEAVVRGLRGLCTPMGQPCDEVLVQKVLSKIDSVCADGAASVQKCAMLLKALPAPHISIIIRDPAHSMRTSCQVPVKAHENFEQFYHHIFDKRHALVPDIMHSSVWRERLLLAQRHIIHKKGSQGGGMTAVLRHLSFAPQRFDSASSPARKYCAMLSSIAVLLTTVAADQRLNSAARKRAQGLLDNMTPQHIVTAGLFADFTTEVTRYVRIFDCSSHDVARTLEQKRTFMRRLQVLFKDCHVLGESPGVPGARTATSIAIEQAMSLGHLYYIDRALHLWPEGANEEAMKAVSAMREIVDLVCDRIEAELPQSGLVVAFAAFDLGIWYKVGTLRSGGKLDDADLLQQSQERRAKRLAEAHWRVGTLDAARVAGDLCKTATTLMEKHLPALRAAKLPDNRLVWAQAVDEGMCSAGVSDLARWYIALIDGTGAVERCLGQLVNVLQQHVGPLDKDGSTVAAAVEVSLEGPACEEELIVRDSSSLQIAGGVSPDGGSGGLACRLEAERRTDSTAWSMTPFTQRCAELWVAHHGRRFRVYKSKRPGQKGRPAGTDAALARGQAKALDALFEGAAIEKAANAHMHMTVLGIPRNRLLSQEGTGQRGKVLKRFVALTRTKVAKNQVRLRDKVAPALRLGALFSGAPQAPKVEAAGRGVQGCLYLATGVLPDSRSQYRFYAWQEIRSSVAKLLNDISIVVLDTPAKVSCQRSCPGLNQTEYMQVLIAIVARGMSVVDKGACLGRGSLETSPAAVRHKPSQLVVRAKIEISSAFAVKHARTVALFTACSREAVPKGYWQVTVLTAAQRFSAEAVSIASSADLFSFLRGARRLRSACGVAGDCI